MQSIRPTFDRCPAVPAKVRDPSLNSGGDKLRPSLGAFFKRWMRPPNASSASRTSVIRTGYPAANTTASSASRRRPVGNSHVRRLVLIPLDPLAFSFIARVCARCIKRQGIHNPSDVSGVSRLSLKPTESAPTGPHKGSSLGNRQSLAATSDMAGRPGCDGETLCLTATVSANRITRSFHNLAVEKRTLYDERFIPLSPQADTNPKRKRGAKSLLACASG